jgi:hypothetical protein
LAFGRIVSCVAAYFFTICCGLWHWPACQADQPVGITAQQPWLDVMHEGRLVRIEREADNLNQIDPDFALTSRPCPPYCIQPMQLAPGVETIGELELMDYLRRITLRDTGVLVIDSRDAEWLQRSGLIPGAIHLPWTRLHPAQTDAESIAETLTLQFGASRTGPLWNFENAKTWCSIATGHGAASHRPISSSCWPWATRRTS